MRVKKNKKWVLIPIYAEVASYETDSAREECECNSCEKERDSR